MLPRGVEPACVIVEDGRIAAVTGYNSVSAGAGLHDFGSHCILPGLIDTHIHINEPGRAEWEGFETVTRAAAAGGYTCLVDMPLNSIPATTNVEALEEKRRAACGKALVDYAFWGGAVEGNAASLPALVKAGVAGFKTFLVPSGVAEFTMLDEAGLRQAMPVIAESGLPLLAHAELPGPIAQAGSRQTNDPWDHYEKYLCSRPDEAELEAIRLLIRLTREFRCRVHIVHLATGAAIPELRAAREEGLPITVETCPHYLYFVAERIPDGATQFKCAPPIRSRPNSESLWNALRTGDIDLIATDHSPCPPAMKRFDTGNFKDAWGGIASVSVALSAVWTMASRQGFEITDIVRWMSEKPAALAGLESHKGRIAPGFDADLTVFDPGITWRVGLSDLHFRHKISPYLGESLTGKVAATFVRGELVYQGGQFLGTPLGRECTVGKR